MAKHKKKNDSKLLTLLIIIAAIIYTLFESEINETFAKYIDDDISNNTKTVSNEIFSDLKVTFLDVGQADSIFIQSNSENMIIDAGNNADGNLIVNYLKEQGINDIKYVVGTHPHEDHIGGLDDIINNFSVSKIYLPDSITTTKTFESVLDAIENKNMTYNVPKIGEVISLGNSKITVLYTGTSTTDLNMASIVLKLVYKNVSFLFMADAPKEIEQNIINNDIKADILKVGHHGSRYSSSLEFLKKVNPEYAIISAGKDNTYNHPHIETLNNLNKLDIKVLRTDLDGTIIFTSDGNSLNISTKETNTNGG